MQRAALYIRVSTEEQALHGLSIEAQTAALDAWAEANKVFVVDHYIDAGISARKSAAKRPELQRLLRDVQKGHVDLIVFTKLDRWFRNIAEYYKVQEILEKHKVCWRTIHEDYDTSTSSGRLKVNIMLSVAEDEADRTSERIKAVLENKRERGEVLGGKVPLGYRIEGKHLVIDEEKAEIARWMFDQYIALRSKNGLCRALCERYKLTYSTWNITKLLSNRRYIGQAYGKTDFCPPLIKEATFERVQQIMQQRAQRHSRNGHIYLFTGIAVCAECGHRMAARSYGRTADGAAYYRCVQYDRWRTCPHRKGIRESELEDWLLHNLLLCADEYNMKLEADRKQQKQVVDESALKRKMEKLKDLYLNDLIDRTVYERDYTALRDKLLAAQLAARNVKKPIDIARLKEILEVYSNLSRQEQKEFWSCTVSKVAISDAGDFSVTLLLL